MRIGDYKLLITKDQQYLFDLKMDSAEQVNQINSSPDMVADWTEQLSDWENEIDGNYTMITQ